MDRARILFFFTLLAIVIVIARYNSPSKKTAAGPLAASSPASSPVLQAGTPPAIDASAAHSSSPASSANAAPKTQPTATPSIVFHKIAPRVAPAVALISVFDESGKLLRSGTGCFVSHDGRLVTSSSVIQGAAHGVAKTSDGRIINISGILADSAPLDLAVLQVETKKGVNFLTPNKSAPTNAGARIAVVESPLHRGQPGYLEGTIPDKGADHDGDWIETGITISKESVGAPVVNEKGELIGIVTSARPQGATTDIARKAEALDTLLSGINATAIAAWQGAPNEASPPAEGPTATVSPTPARYAKIPVVQADRPGHTRLISSPKPAYPTAARHSYFPLKGSGRYRVSFDAKGQVKNVAVLESTRSDTLDAAAIDALRRWKAAPGQEWSATVPVTFQP